MRLLLCLAIREELLSERVVWVAALPAWALRSPRGTRRSIRCSRNALREDKTEYENGVAIVSTHRLLWLREQTLLAVPLSTIANVSVVVWHMALPPLPSSPALALALALALVLALTLALALAALALAPCPCPCPRPCLRP